MLDRLSFGTNNPIEKHLSSNRTIRAALPNSVRQCPVTPRMPTVVGLKSIVDRPISRPSFEMVDLQIPLSTGTNAAVHTEIHHFHVEAY